VTTFFEHQRASYKRNYMRNLICLATVDGKLDDAEINLIHKIGAKRGLKVWQINELIESPVNGEMFLPESMSNRMDLVYDLMQIVHIDNEVTHYETEFMMTIIEALNLQPEIVSQLMTMFREGVPSIEEWKEFVSYTRECERK
jgi:uncharacterized tellurite resistance protein B-like protein